MKLNSNGNYWWSVVYRINICKNMEMNDLIKEAIWDAKIYRFSVYEDDAISENDGDFILCSKVDVCINDAKF